MRNSQLVLFLFLMFKVSAQTMESDTINLSSNISLFQKKENSENQTSWKLYLQKEKEDKLILLDSFSLTIPTSKTIFTSNNDILEIPNLLCAIKDDSSIYTFIFKERALWLYRYNFVEDKFESKRIKIFNMLPGSVDNFGEASFDITHFKISNDDYFNISHHRVIGRIEMLVKLDKNLFRVNELIFAKVKNKIKVICMSENGEFSIRQSNEIVSDYNKMSIEDKRKSRKPIEEIKYLKYTKQYLDKPFYYLKMSHDKKENEDKNTELRNNNLVEFNLFNTTPLSSNFDENKIQKAEQYLKDVLYFNGNKKNVADIKLLGYFYDSGQKNIIYFYYQEVTSDIKIIRYDRYESEWLLGDYKEEEIKQE
jgi:hypothetical protein